MRNTPLSPINIQTYMWRSFDSREIGLPMLRRNFQMGADPDNKIARFSPSHVDGQSIIPTVLNTILFNNDDSRNETLDVKTVELAFEYGADVEFNRRNYHFFDTLMTSGNTKAAAVTLAEMAARQIMFEDHFELPIAEGFAVTGRSEVKKNEGRWADADRELMAIVIQTTQHALVDYVREAQTPAARYLRQNGDHPSGYAWGYKMVMPDHKQYPRPHPEMHRYFKDMDRIRKELSGVKKQFGENAKGTKALRDSLQADLTFGLVRSRALPVKGWKPKGHG